MQIVSNIFPRKSLHCKLDPVQYREYEYGQFLSGFDPGVKGGFDSFNIKGIQETELIEISVGSRELKHCVV